MPSINIIVDIEGDKMTKTTINSFIKEADVLAGAVISVTRTHFAGGMDDDDEPAPPKHRQKTIKLEPEADEREGEEGDDGPE